MNFLGIFMASILTENIILTKFLGICPFIGTSNKEKDAIGMGLSVTLVVTLSSIITYLLNRYVLIPSNTEYLRTVLFILVIASMVQALEMVLKKVSPKLHKTLGIYLPLIATNCAVLGITLINVNNSYTFAEMLTFTIGSGIGYTLLIYLYATIRERMEISPIPDSFKGVPIALITAGIMAMLFSRYM